MRLYGNRRASSVRSIATDLADAIILGVSRESKTEYSIKLLMFLLEKYLSCIERERGKGVRRVYM